jgi:hypothetical protein
MSHWVEWNGKNWPRSFFDPPPDLPPEMCGWCGGLGVVPHQIDEERYDVAVTCPHCRGSGRREKPVKAKEEPNVRGR